MPGTYDEYIFEQCECCCHVESPEGFCEWDRPETQGRMILAG